MDSSGLKLFSMMKHKLDYMSERQRVLSQNIANANTPSYKAKDIKKDFSQILSANKSNQVAMSVTDPKHIQPRSSGGGQYGIAEIDSTEMTLNGNNVVIEDELMKMQQNSMDYQSATELYRKMAQMLRIAIGEN